MKGLQFIDEDWEQHRQMEKAKIVEELASQIHKKNPELFSRSSLGEAMDTDAIKHLIKNAVLTREDILPYEVDEITEDILGQATGYGPLSPFFLGEEAKEITEVMVNPSKKGPQVFYGKHGRTHFAGNHYFKNNEEVRRFVQKHCDYSGRPFTAESPIVDAWLPDGSRLAAIGYKASPLGTAFTIRKSPTIRPPLPLEKMVENATFPQLFYDIAKDLLVLGQANLAVCGRTDSGKTTILRAMGLFIPEMDRVIIGETSFELYMPNLKNCINMVTVKIGEKEIVRMPDICDSMNRNNPDRGIVSETRAGEIVASSEIAESTSGGFWTTFHAGGVNELRSRFPKMFARGGMTLPRDMVDDQIRSMFHFLIFVDKDFTGKRTFMSLVEVTDEGYNTIIRFDEEEFARTKGKSRRWIYENPITAKRLARLAFRGATIKPVYEEVKGKYLYPGLGVEPTNA